MARATRVTIITVLSLLWLAPTYLLIVNAFKSPGGFSLDTLWQPAGGGFSFFSNLSAAWHTSGFGTPNLLNSILYALGAPAIAVLLAALAGFAIVVLRVPFGSGWFMLIFGGTILPLQMLAVPLFLGYGRTHLYDTQSGLLLAYAAVAIPFAMFVMRNYFGQISRSIYEAATMDGATRLGIFFKIYIPMSWNALTAVFVLQFTFVWNDLFLALSLSTSTGAQGLTPALAGLQSSYGGTSYPVALAASLAVALPTVLLFVLGQRFFTAGLALEQS
ncbi:MAG TPA: carbohydrate ABC transporter permease [Trebonia sp.]|jgi:multiple sugar transport system permease protein|nr:carbohydrate ABC transporter permease [Trebonia sp.]